MTILIRRRDILLTALFCGFFACFSLVMMRGLDQSAAPVFSLREGVPVTVVVDPGHGGEDGGAVSGDGVEESRLNLEVSLRLNELLRFTGQRTIMTRSEDISISDEGLDTIKARKASDLRNRVALVNGTENAVLLSIHQNSLPSSTVTHGAQVFWNTQPGAEELAVCIQDVLNGAVNTGNEKHPKAIPQTIYLTKHAQAPSVVVECGFLSNPAETLQLQQPAYQVKLAAAVAAGYLRCLKGE
ncbi:MAG: N-acetylmuramoyl-L-alanine amidase [Oscillospiraceae bacterium]|nr:N-acetylmuramoyl-L-alanine amidase [Oscillospiraceae bacterium]